MKTHFFSFYSMKRNFGHLSSHFMKDLFILFLFLLASIITKSQYYYKDIIVTRLTIEKWKHYQAQKVRAVRLISVEGDGKPTTGFDCKQTVTADYSQINTYTLSNESVATTLSAFYGSGGLLVKTVDTSDTYQSVTEYIYDASGRVLSISNNSVETDNQVKSTELHRWEYLADGTPTRLLKIKDGNDTTFVRLVADEKGNVVEEHPVNHRIELPVVYYYYNQNHQLTDIVRFNNMAKRLLPDYVFEYTPNQELASMLFVVEGTGEYQKWVYEYNDRLLKTREICYDKRRELMGSINYQYEYAR